MSPRPRILVMGAGSIGTRHIRNLHDLGAHVDFVDPSGARPSAPLPTLVAQEVFNPSPEDYDGIVIATPNSMHHDHLHWALAAQAKVLVEKPMVTSTGELDAALVAESGRILVGYNLRFHSGYSGLRDLLFRGDIGRPMSARLWFGSYLPDWRPTIDYRESYSARRELGGGVLRDASHELDLAAWFFGHLHVTNAWMGRMGDLEIDVEDTVRTMLRSADGVPISIELDYLSRTYRRGFEIIGTEGSARFDWPRQSITVERPGSIVVDDLMDGVDDSYVRLAAAFLAHISGDGDHVAATGLDGCHAVELVESIEERS
jgi:predicted dehydrogenase